LLIGTQHFWPVPHALLLGNSPSLQESSVLTQCPWIEGAVQLVPLVTPPPLRMMSTLKITRTSSAIAAMIMTSIESSPRFINHLAPWDVTSQTPKMDYLKVVIVTTERAEFRRIGTLCAASVTIS
jgi:hypothetical protein